MKQILLFLLCVSFGNIILAQDKKEVSFSKDVFPLFKAKCLKCHEQDDENPNEFAMDNYELLIRGGKTKGMIVPGKADESYLIIKLLPNPPKGKQMPIFSKKKLEEEEIELIRRWINQGAKND
jgi:hypothetical protein